MPHSPDENDFESASRPSARRLELLEFRGFHRRRSTSRILNRSCNHKVNHSESKGHSGFGRTARLVPTVGFPPNCGRLAAGLGPILDRSCSHEANLSESKRHSGFVPNRDDSLPTPNFPCFWRSPVLTWSLDAKSDINIYFINLLGYLSRLDFGLVWDSAPRSPRVPQNLFLIISAAPPRVQPRQAG